MNKSVLLVKSGLYLNFENVHKAATSDIISSVFSVQVCSVHNNLLLLMSTFENSNVQFSRI